MNCDITRDWLLTADNVAKGPPNVAEHLTFCAGCRAVQADLVNLEQRWRGVPLPPQAEVSKQAFLQQRAPMPVRPARSRRLFAIARWSVAALLVIGIGGGALLFWPTQQVEAHADVLDQLLDWNLDMSEAPTPVERQRIYRDRHESLKKSLKHAKLSHQERELGESLLDNGNWLAEHQDAMEELRRYHRVADRLLDHVNTADAKQADRFAKQFVKVNTRGIDKSLARIRPDKFTDPEHKNKFNKLLREDADRDEKIIILVEKAPDYTKRDLRHALELSHKRPKPKKINN